MGNIKGEKEIEIEAPPQRCFDALVDFETYPEWQQAVKRVEVRERDDQGRPTRVIQVSDAIVKEVKYDLLYTYDEPNRITWKYLDGDVKDIDGEWKITEAGEGRSHVRYRLEVDPGRTLGFMLRGPVKDKVRDHVLGGTVEELKQRVEGS
ncbi:MAG: SRPBCC family protein [Solirubrobacterales bacterium]